jgi:hypothetical protein
MGMVNRVSFAEGVSRTLPLDVYMLVRLLK